MKQLLALLLLCPALALGNGVHPMPPPVTPPATPPPVTPAPASSSTSLGPYVLASVAIFFLAVIIEHHKCVQEKRACYKHEP